MTSLSEIRAELDAVDNQIDSLHKDETGALRDLTQAQQTRFDALMVERAEIKEKLAQHEAIAQAASLAGRTAAKPDAPNVNYLSAGKAWQVRDGADGDEAGRRLERGQCRLTAADRRQR